MPNFLTTQHKEENFQVSRKFLRDLEGFRKIYKVGITHYECMYIRCVYNFIRLRTCNFSKALCIVNMNYTTFVKEMKKLKYTPYEFHYSLAKGTNGWVKHENFRSRVNKLDKLFNNLVKTLLRKKLIEKLNSIIK